MSVLALIPFKPVNPKTRISCVLNQAEREDFARAMLRDVIHAVIQAGCEPIILSTHPFSIEGAQTVVMKEGLNEALNAFLATLSVPVLIIMSDLPLVTPESVRRVIFAGGDASIVPGRGGGTNILFIKRPREFHVDYYGASYLDHMRIFSELGWETMVVDSHRLSTDIDEKEDLVEVLLHGTGNSRNYLEDLGFSIEIDAKGRVGVRREFK